MEAGVEEVKKSAEDNDEEPGVEVKESDIEAKEDEVAENDDSEEDAEGSEKEKLFDLARVSSPFYGHFQKTLDSNCRISVNYLSSKPRKKDVRSEEVFISQFFDMKVSSE